ncbi:MAG: hypothetical protein AB4426_20585 [Xenococcaceae cyanobacterium]
MNETFGRRLWSAALTGIPFAVYKMGFGWWEFHHDYPALGVAAMIWGAVDMGLNILAVPLSKIVSVCFLANVGRWLDRASGKIFWEGVLLAIDTTAAFLIVSVMIWFGRLPLSPQWTANVWNMAVIGNILSVGLEQLYRAIRKR